MTSIDEDESNELSELEPAFESVDMAITSVAEKFDPLLNTTSSIAEMKETLPSLQKAKLDLISLYAANSMFWVYLRSQGVNPGPHGLQKELSRVKTYMARLNEIEQKALAPKVNKDASKRVMRNALWSAAHKPTSVENDTAATSGSTVTPKTEPSSAVKTEKRKTKKNIPAQKKSKRSK